MKYLTFLASLAAIANAVPVADNVVQADSKDVCFFGSSTCTPPTPVMTIDISQLPEVPVAPVARDLNKRVPMREGYWYSLSGWVFSVGQIFVKEFRDSSWRFDKEEGAKAYLATQFANSVTNIFGENATTRQSLSGGWSWFATAYQGYEFKDMPWDVAYRMMSEAIESATDWITSDNYVTWSMYDTAGNIIYKFAVFPTDSSLQNPVNEHEEF
ncbi:uncharacterized protein ColSpa_02134 [Colletotrichum spaethianum]|uniref:Uncharacterized protein n=1 Tax=Colletotrichum spaethianum TaxID=700344 RepID=A0AA37L4X1_9PEZI|nr:uncharacterized protein ColSpa_02134 [Colletotrichum spaethianum]GKT41953.1 hypothetical protein ColSpa_02134 [Colletotrichum spaethianum]